MIKKQKEQEEYGEYLYGDDEETIKHNLKVTKERAKLAKKGIIV